MSRGYYSAHEAAKFLDVKVSTIRTWQNRAHLPPGTYMGGVLRWSRAQLVKARDSANGKTLPIPASGATSPIEAHCGCGNQALASSTVEAGMILVTCDKCGSRMAIEVQTQYVYRADITAAESVAPGDDPGSLVASRAAMLKANAKKGEPMVYFIRLGPYVKIGTSRDVKARISALALAPGNLLAVIPGSYDVEHAMHKRFAGLRSFKEWFYFQDELKDYVIEVQRSLVEEITGAPGAAA